MEQQQHWHGIRIIITEDDGAMIGGTIQEEASEDIIWRKCFSSPRSLVNVVKSFSLSSAVAGVLLLLDGTMSHCCSSSLFRNPSRRGSAKKLVCRMCCKSNDNKPIVCVCGYGTSLWSPFTDPLLPSTPLKFNQYYETFENCRQGNCR